jgi:hypothetical protein
MGTRQLLSCVSRPAQIGASIVISARKTPDRSSTVLRRYL